MEETCTLTGVCRFLGPHPRHCSAIEPGGGGGGAAAGWPCVRAPAHAGVVHAYGVPRGAAPVDAGKVCGLCLHVWPAHLFECPQYQEHGTGAPPAPWPIPPWPNAQRAPGRGLCRTCQHMDAHWSAAGQDVCSAPEPCVCEYYNPGPPPGLAPTSTTPPTSAPSSSSGSPDWNGLANDTMANVGHMIGLLAGLSRRLPLLVEHLQHVSAGTAGFSNPIKLRLSTAEVLEFLQQLEPALKVAVRLSSLALTRERAPDGEAP